MSLVESIPEVIPVVEEAPPSERLPALDLLRGIAILAILPANIPVFSGAINMWNMEHRPASWADHAVMAFSLLFVFGKFITILSILFGAGLALQLERARAARKPFGVYYVRRMAILFGIGLVHLIFLWFGDILTSYAIVALMALLCSSLSQRGLLWGSGICLIVATGWLAVIAAVTLPYWLRGEPLPIIGPIPGLETGTPVADPRQERARQIVEEMTQWWQSYIATENQTRIWRDGSMGERILSRALYLVWYTPQFWLGAAWYILPCFLIGIYLMRRGVFSKLDTQRPFVRRMIVGGLAVGLPWQFLAVGVYAYRADGGLYMLLLYSIGALPLALAYLGLVLFWSNSGSLPRLQGCLQAVGRMALTNYILQSVLCNLIFYSHGLRLYGQLGHAACFGVVLAIWLVEVVVSVVWMRRFPMGPIEWLWRSLAAGSVKVR
jgi:uncharacterized protein